MTNLTEKIDELQAQLLAQHNAMMIAIDALVSNSSFIKQFSAETVARITEGNAILAYMRDSQLTRLTSIDTSITSQTAKLDAINVQLNQLALIKTGTDNLTNIYARLAPVSNLTGIKTDTTSLTAIKNNTDDIHLDTMSMDLKLLRLRDAVASPGTTINQAANTDIYSYLAALVWSQFGITNPTLGGAAVPTLIYQDQMKQRFDAVLGLDADAAYTMLYYLAELFRSTGSPTGDATTTELGLLASIAYSNARAITIGQPPVPGTNGLCANPYISKNAITANARNYVLWTTPIPLNYPYTLTAGASGVAGTQLNAAAGATMNNLNVYVYSRTAGVWKKGSGTNVYRTNELIQVGGTTLEISVELGQDAQAYLCIDGATEAGPGMELFVSAVSKLNRYANSYMLGIWGQGTSQITAQDGLIWTSTEGLRVFRPGNWINYRITNNSNSVFYIYDDVRVNANPMMTLLAGATQSVPRATTYIFAFRNTTTNPFEGAFGPPL